MFGGRTGRVSGPDDTVTRTARTDASGRLHLDLTLGTGNPRQQYQGAPPYTAVTRPGLPFAVADDGNVFARVTVTVTPA